MLHVTMQLVTRSISMTPYTITKDEYEADCEWCELPLYVGDTAYAVDGMFTVCSVPCGLNRREAERKEVQAA